MCELLVGPAVRLVGVVDERDGPLFVHIKTIGPRPPCPGCGGSGRRRKTATVSSWSICQRSVGGPTHTERAPRWSDTNA